MEKIVKVKEGINLHFINTNKYKTNVITVFLTTELNRENVTKEALIPAILRLGTNKISTQRELNKKLENMYGASFNCGIEKRGDNHILKLYLETINDEFTLEKEEILKESIELIFDIILNPVTKEDSFNKEYLEREKKNLTNIIQSRMDNKTTYAYSRCLEEMYKNKRFGIYEYGYIEDLSKIDEKNLYKYYKELLQKCKIDIFISGNIKNEKEIEKRIKTIIEEKYSITLIDRNPSYIMDSKELLTETDKNVEESMNITQGKLIISLNIAENNNIAACNVYNAILGGGANSKMFQNVREKASLAYTAGSGYLKTKNIIVIRCGIEIKNYNKAVEIIKKQLEDMKNENFSDKDILDAKQLIIGSLQAVKDEQISQISYEFSKELSKEKEDIDELIKKIKDVSKEDIVNISKNISINTIYFLKN